MKRCTVLAYNQMNFYSLIQFQILIHHVVQKPLMISENIDLTPKSVGHSKSITSTEKKSVPLSSHVSLSELEKPIFSDLIHLRHRLTEFHRKNKHSGTFEDMNRFSSEIGEIMNRLREVRQLITADRNMIDDTLDYIWSVIFKQWIHIADVTEPLYPTYSRLALLMRQLEILKNSQSYSLQELNPFQERLHAIKQEMVDNGIELTELEAPDHSEPILPSGQSIVSSLVKRVTRNLKYMMLFASSVPAELVEIHEELMEIHGNLKCIIENGDLYGEDLGFYVKKLGAIDALRIHQGRFLTIPIAQAATLSLLFQCYNMVIRQYVLFDPLMKTLYQKVIDFELRLTSIFNFERFNVSIINLREFEESLCKISKDEFTSAAFQLSAASTKLALYYHLGHSHQLVRLLLLGVEDMSEHLMPLYESLAKNSFCARDELFKAIRHASHHDQLHQIRKNLLEAEEKTSQGKCRTQVFEGAPEVETDVGPGTHIPSGQTIIKAFVQEIAAQTDLMEAWMTLL